MRSKKLDGILVSSIVVVIIGCGLVVLLAVFLAHSNGTNEVGATTTKSTNPIITVSPSSITATTTAIADPGVTIISPTVAIGQKVSLPLDGQGTGITLVRTDLAPIISLTQARTAVFNRSLDWALGGTHEGKTITLTAAYGLVTIGQPTPDGKGWIGSQNIPLQTCTTQGTCTATGTVLPHIEGRPMWVLDYGNTDFPAAGQACTTTPCPTPQIFNHSVYTVDALTNSVISADFYTAP